MTSLPDRKRPRLAQPAQRSLVLAARALSAITWRALHPAVRGRFLEAKRPNPLRRLYYEAPDGWSAPVHCIEPRPGGAGEPVLLAHGLGMSSDAFRYGDGQTLAGALTRSGFRVYLLSHRGDREAIPPRPGVPASFDEAASRDLPAALDAVAADAGYESVHLVGHGLGGQLALVAAPFLERLATVTALAAPVVFPTRPTSHRKWAATGLALLPPQWRLPLRRLAQVTTPLVEAPIGAAFQAAPAARVRGAMAYASQDVPLAMFEQVLEWLEHGTLVSAGGVLEYVETFPGATAPLLAVWGTEDPLCVEAQVAPAVARWGGEASLCAVQGHAHYDLVVGASDKVLEPVVSWLDARRRRAWTAADRQQSA